MIKQVRVIYKADNLPFRLWITREGSLYVVRYGHEITRWNDYREAMECFKVCLTHALECEGKFNG